VARGLGSPADEFRRFSGCAFKLMDRLSDSAAQFHHALRREGSRGIPPRLQERFSRASPPVRRSEFRSVVRRRCQLGALEAEDPRGVLPEEQFLDV